MKGISILLRLTARREASSRETDLAGLSSGAMGGGSLVPGGGGVVIVILPVVIDGEAGDGLLGADVVHITVPNVSTLRYLMCPHYGT